MRYLVLTGAALSWIGCGSSSDSRVHHIPGGDRNLIVGLGQGLNHINQTSQGSCVDLGPLTSQIGEGGRTVEFRMIELTSESSLRESLNVSASASIKSSVGGGSVRATYAQSVNKNKNSRYLMVHTRITHESKFATTAKLKQSAINLLKTGQQQKFVDNCGTEYVYGYTAGSEFFAIFEYDFASSEEEKKFTLAVSRSAPGWKVGADINAELEKFNMSASVHVKMLRIGGNGAMPKIDDISEYGRKFPEIVESMNSAVAIEMLTRQYTGVEPLDLNPNPMLTSRQNQVIIQIANNRDNAMEYLNSIRHIKNNRDMYVGVDDSKLDLWDSLLNNYINLQLDAGVACFDDIWKGCKLPEASFPSIHLPNRVDNRSNVPSEPSNGNCPVNGTYSVRNRMNGLFLSQDVNFLTPNIGPGEYWVINNIGDCKFTIMNTYNNRYLSQDPSMKVSWLGPGEVWKFSSESTGIVIQNVLKGSFLSQAITSRIFGVGPGEYWELIRKN